MPRRVLIVGASGTGKTTVAARLADQLAVPHVELDALHHGPNWSEPDPEKFRRRVLAALEDDRGWVVDGLYQGKLGTLVLERADTLVWLDLPLHEVLPRLWRRTSERIRDDVELWAGNKESWRNALAGRESLFVWALRSHVRLRRELPRLLVCPELSHLTVIRYRSQDEVEGWLEGQGAR
jgi:adenylate kinase family enzyme